MSGTVYPLLFHLALYIVLCLCLLLICAFYLRITCVVWGRGRGLGELVAHRDYTPRSSAASNVSERSYSSSQNVSVTSRSVLGGGRGRGAWRRLGRTTRMLGLVTFVFLLGYAPSLTVHGVYLMGLAFQHPRGYSSQLLYQLCVRSYFLSSAANPLIYSVLNIRFRKESMVALKNVITKLPTWLRKRVRGEHEVT